MHQLQSTTNPRTHVQPWGKHPSDHSSTWSEGLVRRRGWARNAPVRAHSLILVVIPLEVIHATSKRAIAFSLDCLGGHTISTDPSNQVSCTFLGPRCNAHALCWSTCAYHLHHAQSHAFRCGVRHMQHLQTA